MALHSSYSILERCAHYRYFLNQAADTRRTHKQTDDARRVKYSLQNIYGCHHKLVVRYEISLFQQSYYEFKDKKMYVYFHLSPEIRTAYSS